MTDYQGVQGSDTPPSRGPPRGGRHPPGPQHGGGRGGGYDPGDDDDEEDGESTNSSGAEEWDNWRHYCQRRTPYLRALMGGPPDDLEPDYDDPDD